MNEFHNEVFFHNIQSGGKNLFNSEKIISNTFVPNQIELNSSSSDSNDNNIYEFSCKDSNINAINYFMLEIDLKELRGKGSVAYQRNLAYQLLNSFRIRSISNKMNDCYLINQREIYNNLKLLGQDVFEKWSIQAGTNKTLCNFSYSNEENKILKPSVKIYARIKLPFDNSSTEVLKFPKGSALSITISLKSLNEALCYGSSYMTNLTPKEMYKSVKLYAYTYNILLNDNLPTYYIEHEELLNIKPGIMRNISKLDDNTRSYEEVKSISKSVTSIKLITDCGLSGKRFLCYPGYNQSESNWLNEYHNKIIQELIIELDEYMNINDYIKENYKLLPKNTDNFNYNNPILKPINSVNNITININNIPKDKKLYYHTNLLGYNYVYIDSTTKNKEVVVTNISDMFLYIEGEYHNDKLMFSKIESKLDILDISTPFEIWNSFNGFNNRMKSKELDYIIINDNFITGLDFLGKHQPLDKLDFYIDHESSTSKINRSLNNFSNAKVYLLNNINMYDKYPQEYFYKYNHNLIMVKPNTFKINKNINILLNFYDFKNQINEYDITFILKIFSLKEIKVKDSIILSEYI
jgi:hypothetical protein